MCLISIVKVEEIIRLSKHIKMNTNEKGKFENWRRGN